MWRLAAHSKHGCITKPAARTRKLVARFGDHRGSRNEQVLLMLSKQDNALITQTSAGTPMGELMRRYWVPALLSEEVPAPDCPPVQVRVMGEELVAFRDSDGRIGLLAERCSHR